MSNSEGGILSCRNVCWIVGVLLGLVTFLLWGGITGAIVGIVVAIVVALILRRMFCSDSDAPAVHHSSIASAAAVSTGAGASASLSHDPEDEAAASAAASAMTGDEEVAASISGDTGRTTVATMLDAASVKADEPAQSHEGDAKAPAESDGDGEKAPAESHGGGEKAPAESHGGGEKAKGDAPVSSETKAATASAKPEVKPVAADGKPELLDAPVGAADDLKMIKGVGPKLEEKLNALGVWHFHQIAGWREAEVEWVDDQLAFRGRIARDGWIDQAKTLAEGGVTEFSKRASKSGMYDK